MIGKSILGEDVPLRAEYEDDTGAAIDPDDLDTDGTPDADITITAPDDETELVTAAAMSHLETGVFEYVWDTSVDADGTGDYTIDVEAEFNGETKILRDGHALR